MMLAVLLLSVFVAAVAGADVNAQDAFKNFVTTHKKTYAPKDFRAKFETFRKNMAFVEAHDAEQSGFSVALNEFADMTSEEFNTHMKGFKIPAGGLVRDAANALAVDELDDTAVPDEMDWRTKGAVTPVKNQGQCGSCWSFSTTGSIEGAWEISGKPLVSLSEQNLMDCSFKYGNEGCDGGLMDQAFKYVIDNKGIDTEASYPYTARDGSCHYNPDNKGAEISTYKDIPSGNEDALKVAVGTIGPVSVAIDASHSSFQFYSGGVYYEPYCSPRQLDHGVLAAGYGTDNGKDYWLVKNSWGASWGMQGYIQMSRNRNNNCGIATAASYPNV